MLFATDSMNNRILIIGAGGHGKVVADILRARGTEPGGFVDADERLWGTQVLGLPVLGGMNHLEQIARQYGVRSAVVAIGDNRVRQEHAREIERAGLSMASAIHPSATISPTAALGRGVVVCMGVAIGVQARVGELAIINTNATVDHECEVGSAVHICPNVSLAGRVRVGEGAFVGIGSSVIQCRSIGAWATVGAGAVVTRDIPDRATAVGVPAKVIRGGDEEYPRVAIA